MLGKNTRAHDAPQRLVHRLQISYHCAGSKSCVSAPARLLRNLLVVVHHCTRASLHLLGGWLVARTRSLMDRDQTARPDERTDLLSRISFPYSLSIDVY